MADGSANQGALATIDPKPLLEMIYSGKSLQDIASSIGVSKQAIHAWMLRESSEKYHEAITAALVARVAEADERLAAATDAVDVARAREQARFFRMDLERRRPALYGQRQQITHEVGADLGEMLRNANRRVLQKPSADGDIIDVTSTADVPLLPNPDAID